MKRLLIYLAFMLSVVQLQAQQADALKWIIGTWKIKTSQGYLVEQWKLLNDSTFSGQSFILKSGKDTIHQESIQLALLKGNWYYIPTVVGQNNSQAVTFKIQFVGKEEFICTNPDHDFPQRIAYRRIKDQLFASIEGFKKANYAKQNFDFSLE